MKHVTITQLAALGLMTAVLGCGIDVGGGGEWTAIGAIDGALRPSAGIAVGVARVAPVAGSTIRVVTYNILDGGVDPAVLAAGFQADPELARADIILIQEARAFPEEGATNRTARLAQALNMDWAYVPARPETTGTQGNAILSRYPVSNVEMINLPVADRKRQRIAIGADIAIGDTTLHVITTHLDTTLNIADRIVQLRPAVIDQPDAVLVGGDFNTNPYLWGDGLVPLIPTGQVVATDQAPLLDHYMRNLGFDNQTAGLGSTAAKFGIDARLDAVYARGVTVVDGGVRRQVQLSDHVPVWIDIVID